MRLFKPKPMKFWPSKIPDAYETLRLADRKGSSFFVVIGKDRDKYEEWLHRERPASVIAYIIQLMLRGSGNLIDIGAHVGTVSIPVAQEGIRVFSFEMHPENCVKLVIGRSVNRLNNLFVVQAAITDKEGVHYFVGSGPWASITKDVSAGMVAGYSLDILLNMVTPTKCSRLRGKVVLKIDVEGHDYQVLQGAKRTIDKYCPIIIYESIMGSAKNSSFSAAMFLHDRHYILYEIHEKYLVPVKLVAIQEPFLIDHLAMPREEACSILSAINKIFECRVLDSLERLACVRVAAESMETLEHPMHAVDVIATWEASDLPMADAAFEIASNLKRHPVDTVRQLALEKLR